MQKISPIKIIGAVASTILLTAFTFGHEENQEINFSVRSKAGAAVNGAVCKWSNSRNSSEFTPPVKLEVRRSWDSLIVTCHAGGETGTVTVKSQMRPSQMLSIFLGTPGEAAKRDEQGISREYMERVTVRLGADFVLDPAKSFIQNRNARLSHAGRHNDPRSVLPASNFAELTDIGALPNASQICIDTYSKYVALGYPKAFALSDKGGGCSSRQGIDSIQIAMDACTKEGSRKCYLYAIDNQVVWQPLLKE